MKLVICAVISLVLFIGQGAHGENVTKENAKEVYDNYVKLCASENQVTAEELAAVHRGDFSSAGNNVKCVSHCFFQKVGLYDQNDEINEEAAKPFLSTEKNLQKAEEALHKCKSVKGSDKCDTAFEIFKCFKQSSA